MAATNIMQKSIKIYLVDNIDEDGKQYFYKVTVVDKDGLESDKIFLRVRVTFRERKAPGAYRNKNSQ